MQRRSTIFITPLKFAPSYLSGIESLIFGGLVFEVEFDLLVCPLQFSPFSPSPLPLSSTTPLTLTNPLTFSLSSLCRDLKAPLATGLTSAFFISTDFDEEVSVRVGDFKCDSVFLDSADFEVVVSLEGGDFKRGKVFFELVDFD